MDAWRAVRHVQCVVTSDNPRGADNQQERPGFERWVVGFVDGEGCLSISVVRNAVCRLGWQVQHESSVTQAEPSLSALELLVEHFGVGRLIPNSRDANHRARLAFLRERRRDLIEVIVPFFEEHPLVTAKRADFDRFRLALHMMQSDAHLTEDVSFGSLL